MYSGNFQNLEQLERDTKATDFLDFLSQYVPAIVCQMFGVPARLFDLNKTVSNIGTYSIIDNAMKNTIIPMRDHFLGQIVLLLQNATGLSEHIKFDSYEFTNSYNYNNDIYILDVYERLKNIDENMAEAYLKKNLIDIGDIMSTKILSIDELANLQASHQEAVQSDAPVAIQTQTHSVLNGDSTKVGSISPKDYVLTLWLPIIGQAPEGAEIVQDGKAYVQQITAKEKYITPRIARKVRNYASVISIAFTEFKEDGTTEVYTPEDLFKLYELFDDDVIDACEKMVVEVLGVPSHWLSISLICLLSALVEIFYETIHHFFKLISYLVRYNWAVVQGKVKPKDEYKGLAYEDAVIIQLDDVEEMTLTLCKEYNMQYEYIMDKMYYPDVTVLYARLMNEKAFSSYNEYLNMDAESQGKYVTDYGKPSPYIYENTICGKTES